jgi:hypothetical protein
VDLAPRHLPGKEADRAALVHAEFGDETLRRRLAQSISEELLRRVEGERVGHLRLDEADRVGERILLERAVGVPQGIVGSATQEDRRLLHRAFQREVRDEHAANLRQAGETKVRARA